MSPGLSSARGGDGARDQPVYFGAVHPPPLAGQALAAMGETDARGRRRPPRDARPGSTRRGVRPPDRSRENPALDGNGGAGRAAARRALSRQCDRGPHAVVRRETHVPAAKAALDNRPSRALSAANFRLTTIAYLTENRSSCGTPRGTWAGNGSPGARA